MNQLQAWVSRLMGINLESELRTEMERRGGFEVYWEAVKENRASAGSSVTPGSSLQVAAVWACVRVLSETVASLPLIIYERQARGKQRAPEHPLYSLLHDQPNALMTAFDYREVLQSHITLWGNAYSWIEYDERGRVTELWPLRPDRMIEMRREGDRIFYHYQFDNGKMEWYNNDQIWHLRGLGGDGYSGYSPIGLMRRTIGLAMDAEEFGSKFFKNDARPGIVLEHPARLGAAAHDNLQRSIEEKYTGASKSHKPMILEEGMKLHEVGIPPEDAQFLETRQFQVREIARIFRVPPHMIQDLEQATFSNIEHQDMGFLKHTIRPWLVRWEQSIKMNLLPPSDQLRYYAEHLVDGMLRGDTVSRYQAYAVGRQNGWLSANDIREMENMNPVEGGDVYLVPLNMIPADQVGDMKSEEDQASQAGAPVDTARGNPTPALPIFSENGEGEREERRKTAAAGRLRLAHFIQKVLRREAEKAIRKECQDVGAAIRKHFGKRDSGEFTLWMQGYFEGQADWWKRQFLPALESYAEMVTGYVQDELGSKEDYSEGVSRFIRSYIESFAAQQAGISEYRLREAMRKAGQEGIDPAEALTAELEDWQEKRPAEIAREQSTRAGNATAKTVYVAAGVSILRWVSMGDTCPYCKKMDGRTAAINRYFLAAGEKLEVEGAAAMASTSNIGHGPLHGGCDCLIMAG